jgi:hypothetical protein
MLARSVGPVKSLVSAAGELFQQEIERDNSVFIVKMAEWLS